MPSSTFRGATERGSAPIVAGVVVMVAAVVGMSAMMAVMMVNHGGMMGGWWGRSTVQQTPVVASASEVTVDIRDFVYFPADLTVNAGTRVTWVNYDSAPHTATGTSASWDTGRLDRNDRGAVVFEESGSFPYFCIYHPNMKGVVTVR